MSKILLAFALAAFPAVSRAQLPVEVIHTGDDSIGLKLVRCYKDLIRDEDEFELTPQARWGLRVHIVTIDPDDEEKGLQTVYSITWTWYKPTIPFDYYLGQRVGICGAARIKKCAQAVLTATSDHAADIRALSLIK